MMEYAVDAWQRSILYADVMRQRGNQYQAHLTEEVPNVLDFPSEVVMSGRDLPRPVNYWLVRIMPPDDKPTDHMKRPFVVIDPRAGHGPGIGGFKVDSEIGVVIGAGHPCYFIGFLPDPIPGQTIEDVMHAEAAFLEKVIALHPCREGKPAVIGNCQAGWQILMTAAMRPELFGPIIVAGAPLSYWAGWRGRNPMRYAAGLLGGSWLTAMTSDLGAGRFDGAWLVQNFENLNPANTLWSKQHHLYTNIDTEASRYLGFEKHSWQDAINFRIRRP
jgi:pimeloyl-ACP methyl ester carboxylesterase